jgi:hypothetical protein
MSSVFECYIYAKLTENFLQGTHEQSIMVVQSLRNSQLVLASNQICTTTSYKCL